MRQHGRGPASSAHAMASACDHLAGSAVVRTLRRRGGVFMLKTRPAQNERGEQTPRVYYVGWAGTAIFRQCQQRSPSRDERRARPTDIAAHGSAAQWDDKERNRWAGTGALTPCLPHCCGRIGWC